MKVKRKILIDGKPLASFNMAQHRKTWGINLTYQSNSAPIMLFTELHEAEALHHLITTLMPDVKVEVVPHITKPGVYHVHK